MNATPARFTSCRPVFQKPFIARCVSLTVAVLALALVLEGGVPAAEMDVKDLSFMGGKSPDQVAAKVGQPAASYKEGTYEYWLFPNAVREKDGIRTCAEVVFKSGKMTQVNHLPEAVMKKSVEIANGFRDWTPPPEVKVKNFFMLGTFMVGKTKAELAEKYGQPDVKRVFNGKEVWDYQKVPLEKGNDKQLTLYVEFEGDKVSGTTGN